MKLLKSFIIIIFTIAVNTFGFSQKKVSLLVAEYDKDGAVNHNQHLIKYVFSDGIMIAREPIVTTPIQKEKEGKKVDYVRFDIGKNRIYRNRYLITGIGNIIDIKNKKVVMDDHAPFVSFNGDSVIFYTDDIFKGKYYSIYNLRTEKYHKVENANYNPSPTPNVDVDIISRPFSISYYDIKGKQTLLVNDAGYGEPLPITGGKIKRKLPLLWIDKKYFIYANYDKSQKTASIYKVGLDKSSEKLTAIDSIPLTNSNTFFEYDANGAIIYSCGKGRFIIDLNKKQANKIVYENVSNNFLIESIENPNYGRVIKFEDAEIGKKWCRFDNAQTIKEYIAIENDMVAGNDRYFHGVAVWNNITKKWTTLKVFELATIVGWMQEE
jgi:hypothetical protein